MIFHTILYFIFYIPCILRYDPYFLEVNQIINHSNKYNIMYADDTSLFCCLEDMQSRHKKYTLNQELQKVYKWLLANKLKLNVAKTKYMIFS